jgi:hypothetical protein
MSITTNKVYPGDLITADWAMRVNNQLEQLLAGGQKTVSINAKALSCFLDTCDNYDKLVTQGVFIPPEGSVPVKALLQVTSALQRIIMFALSGASVVQTADDQGLLNIFQRLYAAQLGLVALLGSQLLGGGDVGQKALFAQLLKFHLDEDQGSGTLSLHSALNQGIVDAAISAQNRINNIVMNHSGDVVMGNLQVVYQGSDRGETLKLNDTAPFRYIFRIFNKTNGPVNVQVNAGFRQPQQSWSSSVSIVGTELLTGLVPFNPSNPTDPKAYRDVEVLVTTPAGAQDKEVGFLDLNAQIPAPISLGDSNFVKLTIGTQTTSPQLNWVRFESPPFLVAGTPSGAAALEQVSYRFAYLFHASAGLTTRKFRVIVKTVNPDVEAKLFAIDMSSGQSGPTPVLDSSASTSTKSISQDFDLDSDKPGSFNVDVWPGPNAKGKTLTYAVSLESVDGALKPEAPQSVSIIAI